MDILSELNPAQREAVEAIDGPVLILAGPGSGKTRVITYRIAYLVKVCGVNPKRIMAVTFTNKAARAMRERLDGLASSAVNELTLGTFHAICARILRASGQAIGVDPQFVIYDRDDQISLVKRALKEADLDPKQFAPNSIINAISAAKSSMLTPGEHIKKGRSYFEEITGRIYERYQRMLDESNALDFDDLLMKTVHLFRNKQEVLEKYQSRYLHLMVDEFQDTNTVQYELVKLLGAKYRNICVVGDPDQSIYSWRHADLRNILSFEKDYPEARVVMLEENYRSTRTILDTASNIISVNRQRKDKNLFTQNEQGEPIVVVETYTEQEEAQFVVSEIERLVEAGDHTLGEFSVMYRTNAQSRALEEAFVRYGTPYKLVAGTRFYERREIKDLIAYLRLVQNPNDSVSLLRIINVPQRGIGQQTQAKLSSLAQAMEISPFEALRMVARAEAEGDISQLPFNAHTVKLLAAFFNMMEDFIIKKSEMKLVDLFDYIAERSGYTAHIRKEIDGEERWENVLELRTAAQEHEHLTGAEGLTAFLEGVTLVADVDDLDETLSSVTLITLHQAKGLEFPVVFIVGMEDGILPHVRSFDDVGQMEEERRLCYVGVTRAEQRVYMVRAFRRNLMGRSMVSPPSRFLKDIPRHLISSGDWWESGKKEAAPSVYSWNKPASQTVAQTAPQAEVKAGDRVLHTQFGKGMVVSCKPVKDDAEVVIAFNGELKKLLLSLANLEKVE